MSEGLCTVLILLMTLGESGKMMESLRLCEYYTSYKTSFFNHFSFTYPFNPIPLTSVKKIIKGGGEM